MIATLSAFSLALVMAAPDDALAPWRSNHHPGDVAKRHVQEIASAPAEYTVVQGGTMDGKNCRSPQGVWEPFHQVWESNRSVRIENVGTTRVINPWLQRGPGDFRSLDQVVAAAVMPGMTDGEKARALWWQEIQHRFHLEGDNAELLDPVKVFNIYGYNTCGNDSISLAGQWRKAGLKVAPARLVGHCATQVFYDNAWHLMDGDMHSIYLLRDNETVAGEQDLVRDHDLIRRTHTQGILQSDNRAGDEWESSIYVFEGKVTGDRNTSSGPMNFTLRPSEALVWRWGHGDPLKYHGPRPPKFPDRVCNGLWEYRPDFTSEVWRAGADSVESIRRTVDGLAADEGKTGVVVWTLKSPYVFVGGRLDVEGTGAKFALSWDGRSWHDVDGNLDSLFPAGGPARYAYTLRCELQGEARLRKLAIRNDLQMAPLALPGMEIGTNTFRYTDQSPSGRRVRVTHEWVERSASRPPEAPAEPVSPPSGGVVEGTDVVFRWRPAADPDGDAIADYHFELSARADMKWPLSMSFAKLISRTPEKGRPQYTLPGPGLLNPDTRYYWRVRAQDSRGVWGPWSSVWSFTANGPAPPQEVILDFNLPHSSGTLRWKASPKGTRPVTYRVYASDEKGFTASDQPYEVTVGKSGQLPPKFPANFVTETANTSVDVVGSDVALNGANQAFYRVVAFDAAGRRSGASDYAESPRPVITSAPVTRAKQGELYRYPVATIRSLGDLRMRIVAGKETMGFWDVERPRFELQRGPEWLKIDRATGVLSGTPDRSGSNEVLVAVTLERDVRRLDEDTLKWGVEKVVSSSTETAGSAHQQFVIEVDP